MQRPIGCDARLAIQSGHLHQINAAPQNPGDQAGQLHAQDLGHRCAMAERSERSQAFECELRALASADGGGDIGGGRGGFPNRVLRGGRRFFAGNGFHRPCSRPGPTLGLRSPSIRGRLLVSSLPLSFAQFSFWITGGSVEGTVHTMVLRGNLDAGFQDGLFRRRGHQPVLQNDLHAALAQRLLREQRQRLGHLLQNAVARMNQHRSDAVRCAGANNCPSPPARNRSTRRSPQRPKIRRRPPRTSAACAAAQDLPPRRLLRACESRDCAGPWRRPGS